MQFSNQLIFGQYIPGETALHALDPRCKILSMILILCGIFTFTHPTACLLWGCLLVFLTRMGRLPLRQVLRSVKSIWFLLLFTVIMHLFWTPGRIVYVLGLVHITYEGLVHTWVMATRILFLVLYASLLMMITTPMSFSDGLESILSPLRRFGFPAQEIAMMTTIALRFIPTLLEETDRILKAQTSRGANFETKGLIRRIHAYIPVLIPLFIQVFHRADNLAVAMEARCYGCSAVRGCLNPLIWKNSDTFALSSSGGLFLLLIVIKYWFI